MVTNQRWLEAENQCKGVGFEICGSAKKKRNICYVTSTMFEVFKMLITNYSLKT